MDAPALLAFNHVSVRLGEKTVLHDITLSIGAGEHVAILGPNGCGKSTLIKTITRECYPLALPDSSLTILGGDTWTLFALMEVPHLAQREITEMSSGEAHRLLIGRALVHDPLALLLDEPSNSLDFRAALELRDILRNLAQAGPGSLMVTHHLPDILPEIDRVILLRQGRIVADGGKSGLLTTERLTEL